MRRQSWIGVVVLAAAIGCGEESASDPFACETASDCEGVFSIQCPPGSTSAPAECLSGRCSQGCRSDPNDPRRPAPGSPRAGELEVIEGATEAVQPPPTPEGDDAVPPSR